MRPTVAGDTTKIIPPPRRGPRWIDLALAGVAGSLLTLLVIGALFFGRPVLAPANTSPSPSLGVAPSLSASPSISIRIATVAPTTPAPTTAAPTAAPPTTAPPTPTPAATTAPPTTAPPAPSRTP